MGSIVGYIILVHDPLVTARVGGCTLVIGSFMQLQFIYRLYLHDQQMS